MREEMKTTTYGALVTGLLGLTFAMNTMAADTLKLPVMMAENSATEVSTDAEAAVKVEEKQETTTKTTAAAAGVAPKKWGALYLSENAVIPNIGNTFGSQNSLSLVYNLNADRSLQVRQYFLYNMTNQDSPYEWTMGDTALQYTDTSKKIGGADTLLYARAYIPTSYYTSQVGKYELRLYGAVTQAAGKYGEYDLLREPTILYLRGKRRCANWVSSFAWRDGHLCESERLCDSIRNFVHRRHVA